MPAPQNKWWYMWDIYMVQLSILEAQCYCIFLVWLPWKASEASNYIFWISEMFCFLSIKMFYFAYKITEHCDISKNWPLIMCIMKTTFLYCTMHLMRVLSDCTQQSLKNRCCWVSLHFFWPHPRLVPQDDPVEVSSSICWLYFTTSSV